MVTSATIAGCLGLVYCISYFGIWAALRSAASLIVNRISSYCGARAVMGAALEAGWEMVTII